MGKRGPAPKPTSQLKLSGSWRAGQRKDEPHPEAGKPMCPKWIDADAKAAWRSLVPKLVGMGVLTKIDGNALARYCVLWARWKRAEMFIQKNGEVYPIKDAKGEVKYLQQLPQVAIANKLASQLTRLEQEFGLTPSSRTRIKAIDSTETKDAAEAFFDQTA